MSNVKTLAQLLALPYEQAIKILAIDIQKEINQLKKVVNDE